MNVRVSWYRINLSSFQWLFQLLRNPILLCHNNMLLDSCFCQNKSDGLAEYFELIELGFQIECMASFCFKLVLSIKYLNTSTNLANFISSTTFLGSFSGKSPLMISRRLASNFPFSLSKVSYFMAFRIFCCHSGYYLATMNIPIV